jgi:hypothetical protein
MSAVIELVPLNDHGRELLDALEERTDERPFKTTVATGARTYSLDAMLDKIDPGWREHLTRTGA